MGGRCGNHVVELANTLPGLGVMPPAFSSTGRCLLAHAANASGSLRSDAHLNRNPLRDVVSATDWLARFQERKRALTGSLGDPEGPQSTTGNLGYRVPWWVYV